jgi:multisubunit Na+/H+ antiporter MnhG subunit
MTDLIADVLLGLGTLAAILASLQALRAKSVYRRLHYLTVLTSVAVPLVGASLIVSDGLGLTGASVLLIVVFVAVTGPILSAATGRLNAQEDDVITVESPE